MRFPVNDAPLRLHYLKVAVTQSGQAKSKTGLIRTPTWTTHQRSCLPSADRASAEQSDLMAAHATLAGDGQGEGAPQCSHALQRLSRKGERNPSFPCCPPALLRPFNYSRGLPRPPPPALCRWTRARSAVYNRCRCKQQHIGARQPTAVKWRS